MPPDSPWSAVCVLLFAAILAQPIAVGLVASARRRDPALWATLAVGWGVVATIIGWVGGWGVPAGDVWIGLHSPRLFALEGAEVTPLRIAEAAGFAAAALLPTLAVSLPRGRAS